MSASAGSGIQRSWKWIVALSALLAGSVLAAVTLVALRLEDDHHEARAETARQDALQLALWKLDSYLAPLLAREAARPWYHYRPFVPQERAFTRMLHTIEPGEVLAPSPLLGFRSELIPLHFELGPEGWSSPQAPEGNFLDLAQANLSDPESVPEAQARLDRLSAAVDPTALRELASAAEIDLGLAVDDPSALRLDQVIAEVEAKGGKLRKKDYDYGSRAGAQWRVAQGVQTLGADRPGDVRIGPIVPAWIETAGGPQLTYLRRVQIGDVERLQGFVMNWEALRARLLGVIAEHVPDARLEPELSGSSAPSLATLPARLVTPPTRTDALGWSVTRIALASLWAAMALVLGAFAFALHSSVSFGDRRARFASAVTHELRTPLTTFRMYSEMLAKGMVPPERAHEYLDTLRRESDRLSGLVENVLAYARLEDGRAPLRREALTVGALLDRLRPDLERRVEECGESLVVDVDPATAALTTETDPEAVSQILFNLVDNACKYGASPIQLRAREAGSRVVISVEDAGQGVPPGRARAVFRPFDRGGRDEADGTPGVGLGLALARGLARDLHGDLALATGGGRGARFELALPRGSSAD